MTDPAKVRIGSIVIHCHEFDRAKRYPWRSVSPPDFVVLEDPDGNLFCVVQKDKSVTTS